MSSQRGERGRPPKPITGKDRADARVAFEKIRQRSDHAGVIVNPAALAAYARDVELVRRVLADRGPRGAGEG